MTTEQQARDTERLEWALPLLTGCDSDVANARARALAAALLLGLDGRAAIDAAMGKTES